MSIPRNLVLGCGNVSSWGSSCVHDSADFITVDMLPEVKPDILLNIENKEAFTKKFKDQVFSSIIFEHLPDDLKTPSQVEYCKQFLKEGGVLIYVGNLKVLIDMPDGHPVFTSPAIRWIAPEVLIVPKEASTRDLKLEPELQKYLKNYLPESELKKGMNVSYVTADIKKFALSLLREEYDIPLAGIRYRILEICLRTHSFFPESSPTIEELRKIVDSYRPGKIRKFFYEKTKGMKQLDLYLTQLEKDNKPMDKAILMNLASIIKSRNSRIQGGFFCKDLNPTRSILGSTEQVFNALSVFVVRHMAKLGANELDKTKKMSKTK